MSLIVDEHREYLSDPHRLQAFRRAIEETVKPGNIVVDLGAGSGIMGLMACRAGAGRVYAIEASDLIGLTEEIACANGFQDRVRCIKALSTRASLPERADVVVADQIGHFGFEPGILEYFSDAHERFLKPGGVMIPSQVDLYVAPVSYSSLWKQVDFWAGSPAGFNFQPARALAANTGYPIKLASKHLLGRPALLTSLNTAKTPAVLSGLEARLTVANSGTLHGIGGWFSAQLSPKVTMTNSPLAKQAIRRRNVFFPIDRPVRVTAGDRVQVSMQIRPSETMVSWTVAVFGSPRKQKAGTAPKARFTHSTFRGMLLCKDNLQRTQPEFTPKLTSWGQARRTILLLMDGHHSIREIEEGVYRRHHDLFRSLAEAATFVAEVTTRYSE